jgi:DNA-binding NarL/FixJ family response regulator
MMPIAIQVASVLIVDDHPIVVEGLTRIIESRPELIVCGAASSAGEARNLIAALSPDIVVLDLSLKDSSGLDLVRELASPPKRHVVVYSQFGGVEMRRKSKALGASAFLSKSSSGAELATLLVALWHLAPATP